jgi:hypothetical protein
MTMCASLERMDMVSLSLDDGALRNLRFDLSDFLLELGFDFGVRGVSMAYSLLQLCDVVSVCIDNKQKSRWLDV